MTAATPHASRAIGGRSWIIAVVAVILGLTLLVSFDWTSLSFTPNAWSNLISGVQVSTLVVVIAFFLWWARSRER